MMASVPVHHRLPRRSPHLMMLSPRRNGMRLVPTTRYLSTRWPLPFFVLWMAATLFLPAWGSPASSSSSPSAGRAPSTVTAPLALRLGHLADRWASRSSAMTTTAWIRKQQQHDGRHRCDLAEPDSLDSKNVPSKFRLLASQKATIRSIQQRPPPPSSQMPPTRGGGSAGVKTMTARQMEVYTFLSGGLAGTVAATITNPLEVIKAQLQSTNRIAGEWAVIGARRNRPWAVAQKILQKDGAAGLCRGLAPTLVGIIPSRSIYFYTYQWFRRNLSSILPEGSPPNAMVAGFMAGLAGNTVTNPIWMVRTRMQVLADSTAGQRNYANYADAISTIWKEEGIGGFYRGIRASYWGCLEGAGQFIVYEQLKARLLARKNRQRAAQGLPPSNELSKATYFWSAAAAKMMASVLTYPHEVARTRLREQARSGVFKYTGMWQTLGVIAREEGRQGLYSGMGIHLIKVVPNSALMFLTYEIVRTWLSGFTIIDESTSFTDPE